ncbi:hypothetical protein FRC06_006133 [Ceratobasidium sp. 370]|nr:hypothetical protein FRC06_006133 [Ceratobasidium sp. 370]
MSYSKCVTFVIQAPATRVGIVVGPAGTTINNIRAIYQVQINIPSQKRSKYKPSVDCNQVTTVPIKISGNRTRAQDAVNAIEALIASVHHPSPVEKRRVVVDIPQEYHAGLIGRQGKYAKRVETRYGVRVAFEPSSKDQSYGENNSAASSSEVPTVFIEGPLASVEQARNELVECYRYIQKKRSDLAVKPPLVQVPKNAVGRVVGREDEMIESIQQETNMPIHIRSDEEWAPDSATIGDPSAVAIAPCIPGIEDKIDSEVMDEMAIHPKYYR